MSKLILTEANFEQEVLQSDVPVIVDFWASWCGPCQMLTPVIDEVANEADGFKVGSVDSDAQIGLAQKYNITSIPCLIVFEGGKEVKRSVGVIPKDKVLELVK